MSKSETDYLKGEEFMEIKNLSQLKRAFAEHHDFEIVEHFLKPEMTGQVRRVNVLQTNGMYTHVVGGASASSASTINGWNDGKGSWLGFGKASDWCFCDGLCTQLQPKMERKVWTIRVLD